MLCVKVMAIVARVLLQWASITGTYLSGTIGILSAFFYDIRVPPQPHPYPNSLSPTPIASVYQGSAAPSVTNHQHPPMQTSIPTRTSIHTNPHLCPHHR